MNRNEEFNKAILEHDTDTNNFESYLYFHAIIGIRLRDKNKETSRKPKVKAQLTEKRIKFTEMYNKRSGNNRGLLKEAYYKLGVSLATVHKWKNILDSGKTIANTLTVKTVTFDPRKINHD